MIRRGWRGAKLDLHDAPDDHRRVLAVLAALRDMG